MIQKQVHPYGVNIPRSQKTIFKYLNNSITSVNAYGYMLQAGDEAPGDNNNNLDGEIITGNIFTWNGTDESSMTHAIVYRVQFRCNN